MNIQYRLYNTLHSSFFDLISGETEVQQTKGLALILANDEKLLTNFLNLPLIKSKISNITFDKAIINSELVSENIEKKRADIVIRLYKDNKPIHAIIIEAKSINKSLSSNQVADQLANYINNDNLFTVLNPFKTNGLENNLIGIILTKYKTILDNDNFVCLSWNDIIEFLEKNIGVNKLTDDYFYFVTKIKGTMKYYEKEVLSIPTHAKTNELANTYPFIYECPNQGRYVVKSKPLYITFRKPGGGEMLRLYGIEDIIVFNPIKDLNDFLQDESYNPEIRTRVGDYCKSINDFADQEKQFFILSNTNVIELPHKPKPPTNNSFRAYYTLAELINQNLPK